MCGCYAVTTPNWRRARSNRSNRQGNGKETQRSETWSASSVRGKRYSLSLSL